MPDAYRPAAVRYTGSGITPVFRRLAELGEASRDFAQMEATSPLDYPDV